MSIYDRGIRGNVQNPFQALGDASQVPYSNPRIPPAFNGNVQLATDYILDALYPNYKGTVPTKADLPTTAAQNDYYIVNDDGDGKSAGYVYSIIEGNAQWYKRYDVDYSAEGILAESINRTQYMYVSKYGFTDKDASGNNPVTGTYAGQRVFGGDQTGQNLTFTANKVDLTGNVQFDNTVLPTSNNALDLGSSSKGWRTGYLNTSLILGTSTFAPASLNDTSGAFSFNALNLSTTGTLASGVTTVQSTLGLQSGQIADSSGALSFAANNLTTTGKITAGVNSKLADITFTNGQISTASAALSFNNLPLTGITNLTASNKITAVEVDVGSLIAKNQTLSTINDATSLVLQGGTGSASSSLTLQSPTTVAQTLTVTGTSTFNNSVSVAVSPLTVNSNLQLANSGTTATITSSGVLNLASSSLTTSASFLPTADQTLNLGSALKRFNTAYLAGISDGTNTVSTASLLSLRDINTGATSGMSLFYNGTEWLPSIPDTEIDHRTLNSLTVGDSGHTQFALLSGRSGGQSLLGGLASGENLTLDSTANATKGLVQTASTFAPSTNSALDLGTTAKQFQNVYTSGLFYGLRFDQYAGSGSYPVNSSTKIGRVIWDTSANQLLVDNGTSWSKVGNQKWISDVSFDGSTATQTVTVSSTISDARTGMWQLADNTNNFERVQAKLTMTQTAVTITSSPPLPAGSYRLIGFN